MTLTLDDETYGNLDSGYHVSAHLLSEPGVHLFIASHHWDVIVIKNLEAMPVLKVSVFNTVADKILVRVPDVVTTDIMRTLAALFPDKAGSIRRCFFAKGDMREVLKDCLIN